MFNTDGYSLADIAAATGNNNDNLGLGGNGGIWILLLFIIILMGGFGNNYNAPCGDGGAAAAYVASDVQRGFDQSAVISGINGLTTAVNNGFANAEVSRCNSQANILQTLNNNQMSTFQTMSANQANLSNQLNTIAMNQQNCCCENRAGLADLKYTVATENCADRAALSDGLKEVMMLSNANTQTILDKLCQQEIDALKAQNQQLQMQNYISTLAASQAAQTGQILTDNAAQTTALIRAIAPTPIPAYIVGNPYGGNNLCGCACGM